MIIYISVKNHSKTSSKSKSAFKKTRLHISFYTPTYFSYKFIFVSCQEIVEFFHDEAKQSSVEPQRLSTFQLKITVMLVVNQNQNPHSKQIKLILIFIHLPIFYPDLSPYPANKTGRQFSE